MQAMLISAIYISNWSRKTTSLFREKTFTILLNKSMKRDKYLFCENQMKRDSYDL
jgi:hypothetical protein